MADGWRTRNAGRDREARNERKGLLTQRTQRTATEKSGECCENTEHVECGFRDEK